MFKTLHFCGVTSLIPISQTQSQIAQVFLRMIIYFSWIYSNHLSSKIYHISFELINFLLPDCFGCVLPHFSFQFSKFIQPVTIQFQFIFIKENQENNLHEYFPYHR